eukprot:UN2342
MQICPSSLPSEPARQSALGRQHSSTRFQRRQDKLRLHGLQANCVQASQCSAEESSVLTSQRAPKEYRGFEFE